MRTLIKENTWLPGMSHGWGNGYVLIPEGHPAHGKHYDDIEVEVHGGLTFSELIDQGMLDNWEELTEADLDMWMVGFDTAHYNDTLSKWPKEAVQKETDDLLKQLSNYKVLTP